MPVLRPPALEYPSQAAFWKNDYELLVGHDLLAVPVVQPAPTPISVDLPPGSWVHLATGVLKKGQATLGGVYPLSELPLYLRAGAAIPFNARTPAIWSKPWPVDALQVAGRGGWLYAPAAGTTSVPGLTATVTGRRVRIVLHGAPRETQIELVGVNVRRVSAGRLAASDSALRAQTEGWERTQTPFPGVVLKLAPKNGSETVNVTLG